jgi:hypothetical protein
MEVLVLEILSHCPLERLSQSRLPSPLCEHVFVLRQGLKQAGLELAVLLSQPPKCWGSSLLLASLSFSFLLFHVLGIKPQGLTCAKPLSYIPSHLCTF